MTYPYLVAVLLGLAGFTSGNAIGQERESLINPATYRSLAADHRAYRVGDVLTVFVLEATQARSQAATDAASDVSVDVGLSSPSTQYNASLGLGGSNVSGAQTTRVGEVRGQISARVVGLESDGRLRIEGEQSLRINGERQQIRLRGVVRPQDISADNTIVSNRIADADIELMGVGVVSESTRQSVLYRVFKWLRLL